MPWWNDIFSLFRDEISCEGNDERNDEAINRMPQMDLDAALKSASPLKSDANIGDQRPTVLHGLTCSIEWNVS